MRKRTLDRKHERLAERAAALPLTRMVQVGDRESDILALMQRGCSGQAQESLGTIEFSMGARPGHSARVVRQELRVKRVCAWIMARTA